MSAHVTHRNHGVGTAGRLNGHRPRAALSRQRRDAHTERGGRVQLVGGGGQPVAVEAATTVNGIAVVLSEAVISAVCTAGGALFAPR